MGKDGRYELGSEIGRGPRGALYSAMDRKKRVPVVVRCFDATIPPDALVNYAELAARVTQAGIAGVVMPYEVVVSPPTPFAVFAPHDGASLESLLQGDALQWTRAVDIITSCAEILATVLATTGQIHGGLKPSNVWITDRGKALVLDLGTVGLSPPGPVRRGGEVIEYRAPEQLDGNPADARTDVFALGVLLVEMTTGIHPFAGATAFQAAHKLTQTPPDLTPVTRGMSVGGAREVAKFVARALASKPDERHVDTQAFAGALTYVRQIVGAPNILRPPRAPSLPAPPPPAPLVEDPTTILRLPNLREMFKLLSEPAPAPAVAAPVGPRPAETTAVEPQPCAQPPTPPRPVPADSSAQNPGPRVEKSMQAQPRIIRPSQPARADSTALPAPLDRTERDQRPPLSDAPTHSLRQMAGDTRSIDRRSVIDSAARKSTYEIIAPPVDEDLTEPLPKLVQRINNTMVAVPSPSDRTEGGVHRIDTDSTYTRLVAHNVTPADDELATIGLLRRIMPPAPPETTMLLPEIEQAPARADLVGSDFNERAPASMGTVELPSPRGGPAKPADPLSTHVPWILIGINFCVALALAALAWAALR